MYYVIVTFNFFCIQGTPCDLLTGEERTYAKGPDNPSNHLSCSVEMVNLQCNCKYNFVIFHYLSFTCMKVALII